MSTQNVNVARFARNVEWDFFCDFQTPCVQALPWDCINFVTFWDSRLNNLFLISFQSRFSGFSRNTPSMKYVSVLVCSSRLSWQQHPVSFKMEPFLVFYTVIIAIVMTIFLAIACGAMSWCGYEVYQLRRTPRRVRSAQQVPGIPSKHEKQIVIEL